MRSIETSRLSLVAATAAHLQAELEGPSAVAGALSVFVPSSWPPEFYDADAVRWALDLLTEHPEAADWGFYYIVRRATDVDPARLVGAGGFKGAPDADGVVEIGYSIVRDEQRQGYAVEALRGWVDFAFAHPEVRLVVGQTLPELQPSIGVMLKAGFVFAGEGSDPNAPEGEKVLRYERRRQG